MKTAIVTGASTGLGAQFVLQLQRNFPEIECIWMIARHRGKLADIAGQCRGRIKLVIMPMDLCDEKSFTVLEKRLAEHSPDVRLLVNNAGCGTLGSVGETATAVQMRMTDLNVRALTAVTNMTLPYMGVGAHIINVSSIASFCPNPRMTVYSSTKAYVSSFTRGLREELRPRGITVTAVCPGPMDTDFITSGGISGNSQMFDILPYCDPGQVAAGTYRAAKQGRTFYTPTAFYKFYRVLAKVLPQSVTVKIAKT